MSTYKYRKLFSYIALAVFLAISVLAWQHYEKSAMEREEHRYTEYVNSIVKEITERLDKHKMILRGGAGVFHSSEEVAREEWLAYYQYQQVSTLYPGIQGVAFSRVVQSQDLEQHIEDIRAEGFSDYMVWPEGGRDLYAPIVFIEPFDEQNQYYLGYDLFSKAGLRTVMEQAQNTCEASMSGMVSLMEETGEGTQPGFLMFVPVYAQGMPLNSLEERRETLEGYVFGTYFMNELMQGIFADPMHNIDFYIYDGPEASPEALMYYSHVSLDAPGNERKPLFTSQKTLDMFGHQWTMVFETTPVFEAAVDQYTPKGILAAGLLISLLLFFYLRTLETTGDRAHSLAQKMTSNLKESEEKYRLLTENITDVIWIVDLEGRFTYISPAIEKLLGFTPEEIMDMPMHEYIVREDYDALMARLAEELAKPPAERAHTIFMQACYKTKDNRLVYVELNALWTKDGQGNVNGVQGSTRDITERKQLEENIIESRKMYQSVVDTQQEMICRYLPDTTITFVNDAYCKAFGKKRSELLGKKYLMFIPHESHEEELVSLKRLSLAHPSDTREFEVTFPDGSTVWQQWIDVSVFDESGELIEIQGTGHDITGRKQAEDEAHRQAQRAKALLRIASHLNAELELDKVKSIICEEACSTLHMQMSAYLRYDSNTQLFHLAASSGLPKEVARTLEPLSQNGIDTLLNKLA
jgi:PAS domain S-box-containing protein